MLRTLCVLYVLCGSLCLAQSYKCDWAVVGIGGDEMVGTAYRCGATAGQTAAGQMTGTSYWALIGYWQSCHDSVGIREQAYRPGPGLLVTRLDPPAPNPFRSHLGIRYSLAAAGRVQVRLHDLAGRAVRTLFDASQPAGRYLLRWDGRDDAGRQLAAGVYLCRFAAGDTRQTQKLVLQR